MAFLIPDNLRSRKDVSEPIRRVAAAFQVALDEDVTVWYEPLFDPTGERPHLVILEPRIGIVVLEVLKGKNKGKLLGALRGKLRVEIDGEEREVDDPLQRASALAETLRDAVATAPGLADVPVSSIAAFTGIDRKEAERLKLSKTVDLDRCLFKPDLDAAIGDGNGGPLLRVLTRSSSGSMEQELDQESINALRAIIHPDVVISASADQGALFTPGTGTGLSDLKVMDRRQEALAKGLGSGHRVIRGVAGSGKTLVLVHRARMLAGLLPNKQILVTCYTKALAGQLRSELADFENIEVVNLDKLMARAIRKAGMKHPGYRDGTQPVARSALQALRSGSAPKYRAVMVDEAQDFDTEALEFCVELLEATDPDDQDLIIVADSAQNIFRKNFRWKDAKIKAQGRTRLLRVNYRNTREILEFAHTFLTADSNILIDEAPDPDDELTIIPAESSERSGSKPVVHVVGDDKQEIEKILEIVRSADPATAPSRTMPILVGEGSGSSKRAGEIVQALQQENLQVFWVTDPNNKHNKDLVGSADEPIIVSTIASAKGLEFPLVIVHGLGVREDETTARKLLYVGFTRAIDQLAVVVARDSPFVADVTAAAQG